MIPGNKSLSIAVCASGTDQYDRAMHLSAKLSIPLVSEDTRQYEFLLIYSANGLTLKHTGKNRFGPLHGGLYKPCDDIQDQTWWWTQSGPWPGGRVKKGLAALL